MKVRYDFSDPSLCLYSLVEKQQTISREIVEGQKRQLRLFLLFRTVQISRSHNLSENPAHKHTFVTFQVVTDELTRSFDPQKAFLWNNGIIILVITVYQLQQFILWREHSFQPLIHIAISFICGNTHRVVIILNDIFHK